MRMSGPSCFRPALPFNRRRFLAARNASSCLSATFPRARPWPDVFTGEIVASVQDGARRVLEVPRLFGVLSAALLVNDPG